MDIAWKVGNASRSNDWELRMSMRAVWKNYRSVGSLWIIGHIPVWVDCNQIKCLPWPDPYKKCKDANLIHKALRLAMEERLSNPFVFSSDDQFLLQPVYDDSFESWHLGDIASEATSDMSKWQRRLVNTGCKLRAAGYPTMNYEGHVPYKLYKEWIREALRFDFASRPGMCVQSTIINCSGKPGVPLRGGNIRAWLGEENMPSSVVERLLGSRLFASLNNKSLRNEYLVARIEQMFPEAAPWELDGKTC